MAGPGDRTGHLSRPAPGVPRGQQQRPEQRLDQRRQHGALVGPGGLGGRLRGVPLGRPRAVRISRQHSGASVAPAVVHQVVQVVVDQRGFHQRERVLPVVSGGPLRVRAGPRPVLGRRPGPVRAGIRAATRCLTQLPVDRQKCVTDRQPHRERCLGCVNERAAEQLLSAIRGDPGALARPRRSAVVALFWHERCSPCRPVRRPVASTGCGLAAARQPLRASVRQRSARGLPGNYLFSYPLHRPTSVHAAAATGRRHR